MRASPSLLVVLLGGALTSACVAEPVAVAATDGAGTTVVARDIAFEPTRIEVVAGEPTTVHLRNDGGIVHDLVLESGWESGEVRPGETATLELEPLTEPTVAWCSVPGHRSAGMELEVAVVEAGA